MRLLGYYLDFNEISKVHFYIDFHQLKQEALKTN